MIEDETRHFDRDAVTLLDPEGYQALLSYSADLVSVIDAHGVVRYASPSFERTLGYPPSDLIGTNTFSRIHPDDRERVWTTFLSVQKQPWDTCTERFRYRHRDGGWRILEAIGANHLDDPVVLGVVINGRDITEQVQAEQQLREQEARYRRIVEATLDSLVITDLEGRIIEANEIAHHLYGYPVGELIGRNSFDLVHPAWAERIQDDLRDLTNGQTAVFTVLCVRKDGNPFWIEGRAAMLNEHGELHVLSMARDVSERMRSYELLEQRVLERTRELSTLLEVSRHVVSTLELEPLLAIIFDQLKTVIDYADSSIFILEGSELRIIGNRGPLLPHVIHSACFPVVPHGLTGAIIVDGKTIIIDDVTDDSPASRDYREMVGDLAEALGRGSWIGVPMRVGDRVIGVFSVSHPEPGYYTQHHVALVQAIAQQASLAVENARLYEEAQALAVVEERQRLARELHDSVSQALYGIVLGSQTARALLARDPGRVGEPLEYVIGQAEAALADMRALIFELRPETLEREGLVGALHKQADALEARYHIRVQRTLDNEPPVSLPIKQALYRIAQEAMHNTVKHANASTIQVVLSSREAEISMTIEDDGKGFDAGASFPGHLGLQSMRERVTRLGALLEVESTPGVGTKISVRIPLTGRADR